MATNIPPHNLGEVCSACVAADRRPGRHDGPAAGQGQRPRFSARRQDRHRPRDAAQDLRRRHGSIKVQGEWKVEDTARRPQIVITSIPYGVNKGKLEDDIGEIIEARKLPQLTRPDQRIERERTACASPWTSSPAPTRNW